MVALNAVQQSLSESHPATPEAVGIIRRSVAGYARAAGLDDSALDAVRLAVSEAVTNVVLHAYPLGSGQVHVTVRAFEDELWILIADDGRGHNLPSARPGLGWGLALITQECDAFTLLERAEGGTEARMCFVIPARRQDVTPADQ
jgi:anti-sigma regulatory factor (Ser/Thr protein kinase)